MTNYLVTTKQADKPVNEIPTDKPTSAIQNPSEKVTATSQDKSKGKDEADAIENFASMNNKFSITEGANNNEENKGENEEVNKSGLHKTLSVKQIDPIIQKENEACLKVNQEMKKEFFEVFLNFGKNFYNSIRLAGIG